MKSHGKSRVALGSGTNSLNRCGDSGVLKQRLLVIVTRWQHEYRYHVLLAVNRRWISQKITSQKILALLRQENSSDHLIYLEEKDIMMITHALHSLFRESL